MNCRIETCEEHEHCPRCNSINIDSQVFNENHRCLDCKKGFTDDDIMFIQLDYMKSNN